MKYLIAVFLFFPVYPIVAQTADAENRSVIVNQYSPNETQNDSTMTEKESSYPRGFTTSFGRTVYYSSLSNYQPANYDFTIGFGFNISPQFLVGIKIYTGEESSADDRTQPVAGKFDLGGGSVLVMYRFAELSRWRPFITAGYELITILTSGDQHTFVGGVPVTGTSGYNGEGFRSCIGTEYYISRDFSFEGSISYHYLQFTGLIVNSDNLGNRVSLTDNGFGIGLGCNIHFNLLP